MSSNALPLILIEVVLIFGGVLLFGWWQLRSVRRDREKAAAERAAKSAASRRADAEQHAGQDTAPPAASG